MSSNKYGSKSGTERNKSFLRWHVHKHFQLRRLTVLWVVLHSITRSQKLLGLIPYAVGNDQAEDDLG